MYFEKSALNQNSGCQNTEEFHLYNLKHLKRDDQEGLKRFLLRFGTEEACARALFAARWPDGFRCPRCGLSRAYLIASRRLFQCAACKYQASLTAGTVLENTRTRLSKWFLAFFLVCRPSGINAVQLQRAIRVTYKTAWAMLAKIRYAIGRANEDALLSGIVRIQYEVYGRRPHSDLELHRGEHPVIIGGAMDANGQPVRIAIKKVARDHAERIRESVLALEQFKRQYVDPGAADVQSLSPHPGKLKCKTLRAAVKKATEWIHALFGGIGGKHLQAYLDEYRFRYNATHAARGNGSEMGTGAASGSSSFKFHPFASTDKEVAIDPEVALSPGVATGIKMAADTKVAVNTKIAIDTKVTADKEVAADLDVDMDTKIAADREVAMQTQDDLMFGQLVQICSSQPGLTYAEIVDGGQCRFF